MYPENGKSNGIRNTSNITYGLPVEENNQTSLSKGTNPVFKVTQIKYTLILQNQHHSYFFKIKCINLLFPKVLEHFYMYISY